ncbi:MAG: hypothetical protein ACYC6A_00715 [Armatimonadota bacterium]
MAEDMSLQADHIREVGEATLTRVQFLRGDGIERISRLVDQYWQDGRLLFEIDPCAGRDLVINMPGTLTSTAMPGSSLMPTPDEVTAQERLVEITGMLLTYDMELAKFNTAGKIEQVLKRLAAAEGEIAAIAELLAPLHIGGGTLSMVDEIQALVLVMEAARAIRQEMPADREWTYGERAIAGAIAAFDSSLQPSEEGGKG